MGDEDEQIGPVEKLILQEIEQTEEKLAENKVKIKNPTGHNVGAVHKSSYQDFTNANSSHRPK